MLLAVFLSVNAQSPSLDENGFLKLEWPTYSKELEKLSKTDDNALVDLAICYGFGLGVKTDKKKCDKIFRENFGFSTHYISEIAEAHPYASLWWGIFIWHNSHLDYTIKKLKWDDENYGIDHNNYNDSFRRTGIFFIGCAAEGGLEMGQLMYARSNRGSTKYSCTAIRMWNPEMVPLGWYTGYYTKACEWYTKACEHGNPYIIFEYAEYLNELICRGYDESKISDIFNLAYYCYNQAADKGHPASARVIGKINEHGFYYRPVDKDVALDWYRKGMALGDKESYYLAANILLSQNPEEAISIMEQGIEKGDGGSANLLGKCYREGNGVGRNVEKAFSLFEQAVDLGSLSAVYELGYSYEYGLGCQQNDSKAFECYKKCVDAEKWCDEKKPAAKKLAAMYDTGRGIFMNKQNADYYENLYK